MKYNKANVHYYRQLLSFKFKIINSYMYKKPNPWISIKDHWLEIKSIKTIQNQKNIS